MKKIVCAMLILAVIMTLALIKVEKPCGVISGIDGHEYKMYVEENFFETSNVYYKDENGDVVSSDFASAIHNLRACSVCRNYITSGYTKFGNDLFCSNECYEAWRSALQRELGR